MEYDHMAELGLSEDVHLICGDFGFMIRNDPVRSLCERHIRDGGKIYDVLARYDMIIGYTLSREDGNCGQAGRWLLPILKANGVTDAMAAATCAESAKMLPGAEKALRYLMSQMPVYMCTESYEHSVSGLAEATGMPLENISCNSFSFDAFELSKPSARTVRAMLPAIASCRPDDTRYTVTEDRYLSEGDAELLGTVDSEFMKALSKLDLLDGPKRDLKVAGNEKAYALLELCKKNTINVSDSIAVGSRDSDYPLMDIVRDSGGLAMAFNGSEYAVKGCNVAVMSDRPIVAAVLASEFYNGGIESVHEMVEHWNIGDLERRPCYDRHLMDAMLAQFPSGLPEVHWVTRANVKDVTMRSIEFRKKAGFR